MGSDNWTALLAVASSHREPQPAKRAGNTTEGLDAARRQRDAIDPKIIEERDQRRVEIAKLLIDAGADLDADDGYGATALAESIYLGYEQLALFLIESGANPNTKTGLYIDGTYDIAPVHRAVHNPRILAALIEHGANVNVADSTGDTPLHWATRSGDLQSVKLLIEAGADVNARDNDGEPVSRSTSSKPEIKKLLKEAEEKAAEKNRQP